MVLDEHWESELYFPVKGYIWDLSNGHFWQVIWGTKCGVPQAATNFSQLIPTQFDNFGWKSHKNCRNSVQSKKNVKKMWFFDIWQQQRGKNFMKYIFFIPFLTLSHIYMYKLVNKIQIGHSELLKLGKKLILRKTLIFIIFGALIFRF